MMVLMINSRNDLRNLIDAKTTVCKVKNEFDLRYCRKECDVLIEENSKNLRQAHATFIARLSTI